MGGGCWEAENKLGVVVEGVRSEKEVQNGLLSLFMAI
jgi:hypothetical protein